MRYLLETTEVWANCRNGPASKTVEEHTLKHTQGLATCLDPRPLRFLAVGENLPSESVGPLPIPTWSHGNECHWEKSSLTPAPSQLQHKSTYEQTSFPSLPVIPEEHLQLQQWQHFKFFYAEPLPRFRTPWGILKKRFSHEKLSNQVRQAQNDDDDVKC